MQWCLAHAHPVSTARGGALERTAKAYATWKNVETREWRAHHSFMAYTLDRLHRPRPVGPVIHHCRSKLTDRSLILAVLCWRDNNNAATCARRTFSAPPPIEKLAFLSVTDIHTFIHTNIPTQNEMWSRISCLALRCSAAPGLRPSIKFIPPPLQLPLSPLLVAVHYGTLVWNLITCIIFSWVSTWPVITPHCLVQYIHVHVHVHVCIPSCTHNSG